MKYRTENFLFVCLILCMVIVPFGAMVWYGEHLDNQEIIRWNKFAEENECRQTGKRYERQGAVSVYTCVDGTIYHRGE